MTWRGYKLHIDCIDGDIPVSALLTSASLHDSQAAIPLAQMTSDRVVSLYDLMDAAYDAPQIKEFSEKLSHVPIIDPNPRRGEKIPLDPARKARFAQRSSVERVNSYLKDNHGGSHIRVKGSVQGHGASHVRAHCHYCEPVVPDALLKDKCEKIGYIRSAYWSRRWIAVLGNQT